MIKVKVYNTIGEVVGEKELSPTVFGVPVNQALVHQVVVGQQANSRQVLAHTKGRGEVRGGGKKPWKQKGTGRARHGSIRSPIWRGGGVTFGPTKERNFTKKINQKMKRQALLMCLSDKVANDKLIIIDQFSLPERKTKHMATLLNKLPSKKRRTLLALNVKDEIVLVAGRNLPQLTTLPANSLNVVDLLRHEYLLVPQAALSELAKVKPER